MPERTATRRMRSTANQSQNQTRTLLVWGAVGVGVVGLAVLLILSLRGPAPLRDLVTFPRPSSGHDNSHVYPLSEWPLPPAGGVHNDVIQNCGIYTEPVATEHVVHSLEHGTVWITYQPDLPEGDVAYLQDLARGQSYIILSPYPGLRSPVALTAWGLQLELDSAQDQRVEQFIERYRLGPTAPERGGACTGGIGEPIG